MVTSKVCTLCQKDKPLDLFSPHPSGLYGRNPRCKECRNKKKNDVVHVLHCVLCDEDKSVASFRCCGGKRRTECIECETVQRRCPRCNRVLAVECFSLIAGKNGRRQTFCDGCREKYFREKYLERVAEESQTCAGPCGRLLPLTEFRRRLRVGAVDICLGCEKEKLRCTKCGEIKPHEAFSEDKTLSTGRKSWCEDCSNAHTRRARKTPEGRAKVRAYRNLPHVKEKHLKYLRNYFKTENGKAAIARFKASEKGFQNRIDRRARRANAECDFTSPEWEAILARQERCCFYCEREFDPISLPATQDHREPVAENGPYVADNIVASCMHCNVSKGKHLWPLTRPDGTIILEELARRIEAGYPTAGEHTPDPDRRSVIAAALAALEAP